MKIYGLLYINLKHIETVADTGLVNSKYENAVNIYGLMKHVDKAFYNIAEVLEKNSQMLNFMIWNLIILKRWNYI